MKIVVHGTPAPQGSKRGFFVPKLNRVVLTESSAKVKPWFEAVRFAASGQECIKGPIRLKLTFTLQKPKSAPKGRMTWPDKTPDLSKLVRCTEDALTHSVVWEDDARVIECFSAKRYPREGPDALEAPGCVIEIESAATFARDETLLEFRVLRAIANLPDSDEEYNGTAVAMARAAILQKDK